MQLEFFTSLFIWCVVLQIVSKTLSGTSSHNCISALSDAYGFVFEWCTAPIRAKCHSPCRRKSINWTNDIRHAVFWVIVPLLMRTPFFQQPSLYLVHPVYCRTINHNWEKYCNENIACDLCLAYWWYVVLLLIIKIHGLNIFAFLYFHHFFACYFLTSELYWSTNDRFTWLTKWPYLWYISARNKWFFIIFTRLLHLISAPRIQFHLVWLWVTKSW